MTVSGGYEPALGLAELGAVLLVAGLVPATALWWLRGRPLLPLSGPLMDEGLGHGELVGAGREE